jgi:eukaryotic-like serine/threonine-protein kinase
MDPIRHARIAELFLLAVDLPPEQQASLLEQQCANDEALRRSVEDLLHKDGAGPILRDNEREVSPLVREEHPVGQIVAHYRILGPIGAGGMATVYRAQDTRLERTVALKFLSPFLTEAAARERFLREARAIASIDHPNVCTVYEIEEVDAHTFMVMAYVDGISLAEKIAAGPLPLRDALDIAIQTARGLDAAHAKGIVHRDIKPANLMLIENPAARPLVRILDFGVALWTERTELTQVGLTIGTVSYMAPEQVVHSRVDARADIWSLGVVLYQMLTGMLPFDGPNARAVLGAIMLAEPLPVTTLREDVPAALDHVLGRALEKDPNRRYSTSVELCADLEALQTGTHTTQSAAGLPTHRVDGITRRWVLLLALAGALVVVLALMLARPGILSRQDASTLVAAPFTAYVGSENQPAISLDGTRVAFSWDRGASRETANIYVQLIGSLVPLRLTNTSFFDHSPAWSPDGSRIAFMRRTADAQKVIVIPALGGPESEIGESAADRINVHGMSWSPDGTSLAIVDKPNAPSDGCIFLLSLKDLSKRQLSFPAPHTRDCCPQFSPDGRRLAYIRMPSLVRSETHIIAVDGSREQVFVTGAASQAWTADGSHLILASALNLGGANLSRLRISTGRAESLNVGEHCEWPHIRGTRLAYAAWRLNTNIWKVDLAVRPGGSREATSVPNRLISSSRRQDSPQFSPDGKWIAFVSDRTGSEEIWVCDRDGSNERKVTSMGHTHTGTPRWSPDGRWIAFDSEREGSPHIFIVSAAGGSARQLTSGTYADIVPSWSRDGNSIYFASARGGDRQLWKVPATGGQPIRLTQGSGWEAFESADGRYLYYSRLGMNGIWRLKVGGGNEELLPELASANTSRRYWALTPGGVYFVPATKEPDKAEPTVRFYQFSTGQTTDVASLPGKLTSGPGAMAVSEDGRTLIYVRRDQEERDIMLVDAFR